MGISGNREQHELRHEVLNIAVIWDYKKLSMAGIKSIYEGKVGWKAKMLGRHQIM